MFETLTEHKGLASLLFLIIGGSFTYLIRLYAHKKEGNNQRIKNDLLALFAFQAVFAFFTYTLLPDYSSPKSTGVVGSQSLEAIERHLQNHFEDAAKMRQDLRNTIRPIGAFILFSGLIVPAFVFGITKGKNLREVLEKE